MFDLSGVISTEFWEAIKTLLPWILGAAFIGLCIKSSLSIFEAFLETPVGKVIVLAAIVVIAIKFW